MIGLAALLQTASLGDKRLDRQALTLVGLVSRQVVF